MIQFLILVVGVGGFITVVFGFLYLLCHWLETTTNNTPAPIVETPFQKRMREDRQLAIMERHKKLLELQQYKEAHPELF